MRLLSPFVYEIYEGDTFQLDPQSAAALTNRGNVYLDRSEYDQALGMYTQALEVDPNYIVAYTNRGHAFEANGDTKNAIADYKRVIALLEEPAAASLPDNHPVWRQEDTAETVQGNLQTRERAVKERLAALGVS